MIKKTFLFLMVACLVFISDLVIAERINASNTYLAGDVINSISLSKNDVVVGSEDGYVYLFDTYLKLKWRYEGYDKITSVSVSEDLVVAASTDNTITVLDLTVPDRRKVPKWTKELDSYVDNPHAVHILGEIIAVGTRDGYLYAFDTSENLKWQQKTDAYVIHVRVLEDSIVAVSDKRICIFDLEGNWVQNISFDSYVRSAHTSENHITVGLGNNDLCLFDINGGEKWCRNLTDQIGSVYVSDSHVAAGLKDKSLYLYDFYGNFTWREQLSESVMAVATDYDRVIAATGDDKIYAFSMDGSMKWVYETDGHVRDLQTSRAGVFAGTTSGRVYHFKIMGDMPATIFVLLVTAVVLLSAFAKFLKTIK
jgi:hypothetical protein